MERRRRKFFALSLFASLALTLCAVVGKARATPCQAEPTDMAVSYGQQITCSISPITDTDLYRFSGTTGDRILAEALWVSGDYYAPTIKLIAPNGAVLGDTYYPPARLDLVLPQTGTYTVIIAEKDSNAAGDYAVTISCTGGSCSPEPPVCDGSDTDMDGEINETDACSNTPSGQAVDSAGCLLAQFCDSIDATTKEGNRACKKADWQNDEPLMKGSQADCQVDRGVSDPADDLCVPK